MDEDVVHTGSTLDDIPTTIPTHDIRGDSGNLSGTSLNAISLSI